MARVYSSNLGKWNKYGDMFTMVITGIEDVEDLHVGIKLVSSTNTIYGAAPEAIG